MVGIIKETGQVHRNSGVVISKKMVMEIGFILIVALLALAAMQIFQSSTASSQDLTTKQLQQKNTQQVEEAVSTGASTGAANPSQNAIANGQETEFGVTTPWYPISVSDRDIHINKYDINVRFQTNTFAMEGANRNPDYGTTTIAWSSDKYTNQLLMMKVRYRNTQTNQIVEDKVRTYASAEVGGILKWSGAMPGVDPQNIEWQADFGMKDMGGNPGPQKSTV